MTTIPLNIQGFFELTPTILNTEIPVDNEIAIGIQDNLQQGEYVISMRDRTVADINNLDVPLYSFVLEPSEYVEYNFENN